MNLSIRQLLTANLVRAVAWLAAAGVLFISPYELLWASTGEVVYSPIPGAKAANRMDSKLTMRVDPSWVDASGYRPVRIELANSPLTPALSDRNFTIEVSPRSWNLGNDSLSVKGALTIPQGKTAAETTISVPYSGHWDLLQINVYEGRVHLRDMSVNANINVAARGNWGATVNFLIIDKDAPSRSNRARLRQMNYLTAPGNQRPVDTYDLPDFRALAAVFPSGTYYNDGKQIADIALLQQLATLPGIELLPPSDLPEKWIDYTCFDVAVVSLADLRDMSTSEPKRLAALRDWVAAGASLCVYGAGTNFERLKDVEELLGMPAAVASGEQGWFVPQTGTFNLNFNFEMNSERSSYAGMPQPPMGFIYDQNGNLVQVPSGAQRGDLPELRLRSLQMGRVVVAAPDELFPGHINQWSWIAQTIGRNNLVWHQRHGVALGADNKDFWNFLIPGVGMAPVTWFRILISFFVVLIGPVNYLLLRFWKRLYLLLVTVPVGAALVTVCLLGYSLLADGLGVRARVRSYTHLDQRTGSAVSWSRQSYYAGLAPSRGMVYPEDAAVYRIVDDRFDSGPTSRRLEWADRRQNLKSGYISSRITSQFLVLRSHHKTPALLDVTEPAGGQAGLQVENQLGSKIQQLVVVDSAGNWYWAENIAPGETAQPEPSSLASVMPELRKAAAKCELREPPGFNSSAYGQTGYRRRGGRYYYYGNRYDAAASATTSLLETELRVLTSGGTAPLGPRTYLAIVDKSPEVPLGIESARQESSLHVVVGQW